MVGNITSNSYTYFGLDNTYNAKTLYYYYETVAVTNPSTFMLEAQVAYGLNSTQQLYDWMATMDWMIQDYTLGGLIKTRSLQELVYGW